MHANVLLFERGESPPKRKQRTTESGGICQEIERDRSILAWRISTAFLPFKQDPYTCMCVYAIRISVYEGGRGC